MAKANLDKNGLIRKRLQRTVWVCPDKHEHRTESAALKCLAGRPARLRFAAERKAWREKNIEIERQLRAHAESLRQENAKLKRAWRSSEIYQSKLDRRISLALCAHGAFDRGSFERVFVKDGALDIGKLGRVATLHIDDYPLILSWLNGQ